MLKKKIINEDSYYFLRTLEIRANGKKTVVPKKVLEHIHKRKGKTPYQILKMSSKIKKDDIVELRMIITEDLLLDLDGDMKKILNFSNSFAEFLEDNNIILLIPVVLLKGPRELSETELEYIVDIFMGIGRKIADMISLPLLQFEREGKYPIILYPKTFNEYYSFLSNIVEILTSYNEKLENIFGYIPKTQPKFITEMLKKYLEAGIFNYVLEFRNSTPLSLSPILEHFVRAVKLIERETEEIALVHALNVNRGIGRVKISAKDILAFTHYISTYSWFFLPKGFGGASKKVFFIFNNETYFYEEKYRKELENLAEKEGLSGRAPAKEKERSINILRINEECRRFDIILEENGTIGSYLRQKKGLQDMMKKIDKIMENIRKQTTLF